MLRNVKYISSSDLGACITSVPCDAQVLLWSSELSAVASMKFHKLYKEYTAYFGQTKKQTIEEQLFFRLIL